MAAMGRNGSLLFPCCRILIVIVSSKYSFFSLERVVQEPRERYERFTTKKRKGKNCGKEESVSRIMEICCGSSGRLHQHRYVM